MTQGPTARTIARWAGPLVFLAVLLLPVPEGMSPEAKRVLAVIVLMAVWWVTEAVAMAAVSMLPLALFPLLGIMPMAETAKGYADPNIFLFMGGFLLALAMQKADLHKRIAFLILRCIGAGPRRMLAGFMITTALISMWVSNTATALMILPIGLAVLSHAVHEKDEGFSTALMLGIAYAASIGGIATPIGTPPNMIFVGQVKNLFPEIPEIGFVRWMQWALPLAAGFLVITWVYLCLAVIRPGARLKRHEDLLKGVGDLPRFSVDEVRVSLVFLMTVAGWILRPGTALLKDVHDGTIAIAGAVLLFVIPGAKKGDTLLDWDWAKKLPWDVLLLFGGGFALAHACERTGLGVYLAGGFHSLQGVHPVVLVPLLCLAATFLSEFMSNTAQITLMMPVLGAASIAMGTHPFLLMIPATIASSLAFMMPVGTPPNAIAFSSGHVRMSHMVRTGWVLNLLGALWTTLVLFVLARPILGF